ncbi:DUF1971 domain-containing protein [Sandarakinorhabdus oryzae]|uniref:DUF1971 domain-containing protein n=1 Tax=Sandarakinorhabdus oryzae TaxID=2675220 RepID=UPI0012E1A879|nr:DUF1971 domain-containing protein [Sandarakinorhabdus oryzae]
MSAPYRITPVFTEQTLPAALRQRHDTRAGVWGLIRVLSGELLLTRLDPPAEEYLRPGRPGIIAPQEPHFVTPLGPMTMRIEFHHQQSDQDLGD